ncbi:MAG: TldD/PmbA family protein [Candidatus Hodarchaeota archaeon]
MDNKIDVYSLAKYGLNLAEKSNSNLSCAEIFFGKNNYISIEIEENSVKNSEIGSDFGVSIRVIDKRGSLGFAFTNALEKKSIERTVKVASKMMKAGTEDVDFKDLPKKCNSYPRVKGLFDSKLKNLQIEDSVEYAEDLIKICNNDEMAISQSANFLSNYSKRYIFNTNGVEINGMETNCSISSNIIVKDKIRNETSFGYDWQSERSLKNINAIKIAKRALEDAKRNLNRIKIKNMRVPLILTPKGTISFILNPIASAVNGETFQYKRSFLVGKKDKIIGTEYLNIEDNALINGLSGSTQFDGEGVPCKNKRIIENGKFLQLIHNSYTAGKEGVESTGNASRSSYSSVPSIGISNFIMKNGDYTKEEIIKDVNEGIILDYTGDSPNITTGDFSGLILHGNLIENGEIKEPLNETMFGINLLDLFKNIDAVSKEFSIYGAYHAPFVRIKDVRIIGAVS